MKRPFLLFGFSAFISLLLREILFFQSSLTLPFLIITLCLALIFFVLFFFKKKIELFRTVAIFFCVSFLFIYLWSVKDLKMQSLQSEFSEKTLNLEIRISEDVARTQKQGYRYIAEIKSPEELKNTKIIFYDSTEEYISLGSVLKGEFTLKNTERNLYYRQNNITFLTEKSKDIEITDPNPTDLDVIVGEIKNAASAKVGYLFGEFAATVNGFIFGDTDNMDKQELENFRVSGLSHLLAVSGFHISTFSAFILIAFSKSKNRFTSYIIATIVIILVSALSGFSPSVNRAMFMQFLLFASKILYKNADIKNTFGFSLFIILLLNPFVVSSPSFLMSFASTGAIIFLYRPCYRIVATSIFRDFSILPIGLFESVLQISIISILCTLLTVPISYLYFGTASFVGIIANILSFPFVTLTFVTAFIATIIGFIPIISFFALPIAYISKIGVAVILFISNFVSSLVTDVKDLSLDMSFVADYWLLLSVLAVALLAFFIWITLFKNIKSKTKKQLQKVSLSILAVLVVSLAVFFFTQKSTEKPEGEITVTFVDVGQGSAVILAQGEKVYVYDCGGDANPGEETISALYSMGYQKIDKLIISHMHSDHMNGVRTLLKKIPAAEVIIPYTSPDKKEEENLENFLTKRDMKLTILYEDTKISLDNGAEFSLLLKHMDENLDENDNSIVLSLDFASTDLLLCGDLSKVGEKRFISCYPFLETDILSIGHHGSKYSACPEFLDSVSPSVSVISVSKDNSYGHPDKNTVLRAEEYGKVYTTKDFGNITFTLDGLVYTVTTEKS